MSEPRLAVVALAAGEGTRMRSALPKVLHPICGRPMLAYVLAVADALDPARITLVLANDTLGGVRATFGTASASGRPIDYALQTERRGTGHAVLQTRASLAGQCDEVLVLFGDTPLLRPATAQSVLDLHRASGALVTLLSFRPASPTGYGRVVRDGSGQVLALVEERDATPEQRAIGEANSGIMCFRAEWLWPALDRLAPSPVKGEYYMTDLVGLAVRDAGAGAVYAAEAHDEREAWGVNDRVQLAQASAVIQERILDALMRGGATIINPHQTYVEHDVIVGRDTTLWPGTVLRGATRIGNRCSIGPHTTLVDSTIGDDVAISHSVVERSLVRSGLTLEPFSYWRDVEPASASA
ncbi:MAG TPA: sugar phosphate nucleotidyltransferase [Roseiflexaceae bacterium]|nr:sugar phosphate nucleotidyltransferase [Roseiflexaceae bacterium]